MSIDRRSFIQLLGLAVAAPWAATIPSSLSASPAVLPQLSFHFPKSLRDVLEAENRIVDMAGGNCAIEFLGAQAYYLMRARREVSKSMECRIDMVMGAQMRAKFQTAMFAFYRDKFGLPEHEILERRYASTPAINAQIPCLLCEYPHAGVELAVLEMLPEDSTSVLMLYWPEMYLSLNGTVGADHPTTHLVFENVGGFSA